MAKFPAHLWRKQRLELLRDATQGCELLVAVSDRLERTRRHMYEVIEVPYPGAYVSTSVDNVKQLLGDIDALAVRLILRAKGLTQESYDMDDDEVRH
jgi:hypothetical protein